MLLKKEGLFWCAGARLYTNPCYTTEFNRMRLARSLAVLLPQSHISASRLSI